LTLSVAGDRVLQGSSGGDGPHPENAALRGRADHDQVRNRGMP
jgi:hypothetical protein